MAQLKYLANYVWIIVDDRFIIPVCTHWSWKNDILSETGIDC